MKKLIIATCILLCTGFSLMAQNKTAVDPAGITHQKILDGFMDLRFGMFIHWGPVSLSGREISWGRNAVRPGEGRGNQYSDTSVHSDPYYDSLYRSFLPDKDYAEKLVAVAKATGMKYIVFTTKHHDGYPNFITPTVTSSFYKDFFETPLGKSGRDLTREIVVAARKAGLKIGLYYSQRDWTHPDYVRGDYQAYFLYMQKQLQQLLTQYGKIDILWYDHIAWSPIDLWSPPYLVKGPRIYQPGLLINNRAYDNMGYSTPPNSLIGDFSTPEGKIGSFEVNRPWESCLTLSVGQWSWKPDARVLSTNECVQTLVNCAIGGGNFLLNVGPRSDGHLEPTEIETLKSIGVWLKKYGSSIYNTRGGPFVSGKIGGSTYNKKTIYLHILDKKIGNRLVLPALPARIISAATYDGRKISFTQTDNEITINTAGLVNQGPDLVLRLQVNRDLTVKDVVKKEMAWK